MSVISSEYLSFSGECFSCTMRQILKKHDRGKDTWCKIGWFSCRTSGERRSSISSLLESLRCPQHFSFCGACVEQPGWGFSGRAMKSFPRSVLTNWFKSHFQKFSMVNVENVLDWATTSIGKIVSCRSGKGHMCRCIVCFIARFSDFSFFPGHYFSSCFGMYLQKRTMVFQCSWGSVTVQVLSIL